MAPFTTEGCLLHLDLHTQQITLLPTSTERLSISPALPFAKDQTQAGNNNDGGCSGKEIKIVMVIATEKQIKAVKSGGVNSGGNMDRGSMMFTSDVSLPKDE